jgi:hypothetical protein
MAHELGPTELADFLYGLLRGPKDSDGNLMVRSKASQTGWALHQRNFNFMSATLNSVDNTKQNGYGTIDGYSYGDVTLACYDAYGVQLTTQQDCDSSCIRTQVDFMPTFNYELISGAIDVPSTLDGSDENKWKIFVIALPGIINVEFIVNKQLKHYKGECLIIDGRAAKLLKYNDPIAGTNKLRLIFDHPPGAKGSLQISIDLYKA